MLANEGEVPLSGKSISVAYFSSTFAGKYNVGKAFEVNRLAPYCV